jgi:SAM-dependent methyltransferase
LPSDGIAISRSLHTMTDQLSAQGAIVCPVCGSDLLAYGTADYYLPDIDRVDTNIFRCARCQALVREIRPEQIRDHCSAAGYTKVANEDQFSKMRGPYFQFLYQTVRGYFTKPILRCLDFGCSYGHFMELLRNQGCQATGIELVTPLRDLCVKKGLAVFESLDALPKTPQNQQFDLITLIDTLYYVTDPNRLMKSLRDLLRDDGLLLIRVTNRHWLMAFFRGVLRRTHYPYRARGDATITYSQKTLDRLLANNGFTVIKRRYWDRGKRQSWRRNLLNILGALASRITCGTFPLSLGLIVVARKRLSASGDSPQEPAP